MRRVTRNLLSPSDTPVVDQEIFCRGVAGFSVDYYDGTTWYNSWGTTDDTGPTPVAVQVTLSLNRPGSSAQAAPVQFVRIFNLACTAPGNGSSPEDGGIVMKRRINRGCRAATAGGDFSHGPGNHRRAQRTAAGFHAGDDHAGGVVEQSTGVYPGGRSGTGGRAMGAGAGRSRPARRADDYAASGAGGATLRHAGQPHAAGGNADGVFLAAQSRPRADAMGAGMPAFGIADESAKINLNTINPDYLANLPTMDLQTADAIADWRNPAQNATVDGAESSYYESLQPDPYFCKNAPFDSVEELLLVQSTLPMSQLLWQMDSNRNGFIDPSEEGTSGSLGVLGSA